MSWSVAFALFATIYFARAWMMKTWGGPVPYMDEWDAFALKLYRPWLDGSLTWADLFAPHNEHRIVFTRLAALGQFILNGGWNTWHQLLLNAALHALTAVVLLRLVWGWLTSGGQTLFTLLLALLFSSTSGWQNALWGFQSQFYFCNLLSVLALAGLLLAPPFSLRWWLGWLAALLALFTTGGGVLASFAAMIAGGFSLACVPASWRDRGSLTAWTGLAAIAAIGALGWLLRVDVPDHAWLRAHTSGQFFSALFHTLSWPWIFQPAAALLLQAPWLILTIRLLLVGRRPASFETFAVGLGLLAILHASAVAWSRGASLHDGVPFSRYLDVQILAVCANALILLRWSGDVPRARLAGLGWSGFLLAGLMGLTAENLASNLLLRRAQNESGLNQIRTYLANREPAALRPEINSFALHPDPATLQRVLDDRTLGPHLPAAFTGTEFTAPWLVRFAGLLTGLAAALLLAATGPRIRPDAPSAGHAVVPVAVPSASTGRTTDSTSSEPGGTRQD